MKTNLLSVLFSCFYALTAQTVIDWVPFSPSPNKMVYCFSNYNNQLVAAGMFDSIGNSKFNRIAAWDGMNWNSLGSGLKGGSGSFGPFVYDSRVFNNELYVYGNFDSAGSVACKNIAKWDGVSWSGLGSGADAAVFAMAMYNNEIYAAGAFKNIGGIQANYIAKWNGSTWQMLGNNSLKGQYVSALYVFQNQLYAAGAIDSVNGSLCHYVARWNGNVWDTVAGGLQWNSGGPLGPLNEPKFALIEWNNHLLIGSVSFEFDWDYSIEIHQWDGTAWSVFSVDNNSGFGNYGLGMSKIRKFLIYNGELYASGGIGSYYSGNSIFQWSNSSNTWNKVGSGIGPSSRALGVFNGELYCGGSFNKANGSYHNYFAKLGNVTSLNEERPDEQFDLFPNPATDRIIIKGKNETCELDVIIRDISNEIVYKKTHHLINYRTDLKVDLINGAYFVSLFTKSNGVIVKKLLVSD